MTISEQKVKELIAIADDMRNKSYTPYSHFAVGAALLATNGDIYTGCNIENAAFGPTICAERTAIFKAVSEGVKDFAAIAIMGAPEGKPVPDFCAPCGVCRQVMAEFCAMDFPIFLGKALNEGYEVKKYTLGELLPGAFDGSNLEG